MSIFRGGRSGVTGFRRASGVFLAATLAAWSYLYVVTGSDAAAHVAARTSGAASTLTAAQKSGDSTTYLGSNARAGFYGAETTITTATAGNLAEAWSTSSQVNSFVSSQVITSAGVAFWGDQEGYEHATAVATGQQVWLSPQLGVEQSQASCVTYPVGINGAAAVGQIGTEKVVYVADGLVNEYALDASTGAIVWQSSLVPPANTMIYGSPALYNGSLYVGLASIGDCPLVQGKLIKLDATTGAVQATFNVVPDGCVGGGVWSSPAIDEADNAVYITTGNPDPSATGCSSEPYAQAIVKLRADTLAYVSSWQQTDPAGADDDFGAAPTLFAATVNGVSTQLVGAVNKNGWFYVLDRANLGAGPVWTYQVTDSGPDKDQGSGSIAPASFDGTNLYIGDGSLGSCASELAALNPATGVPVWRDCVADGPIIGGVVTAPGLVVAGAGQYLDVFDAVTGAKLRQWDDGNSSWFWTAPTISNGWILVPKGSGVLYGLTVPPPAVAVGAEGTDRQLWVQAPQLGGGWQPLGGVITAPPAVAAPPNPGSGAPVSPLFVATGTDRHLWIRSLTDGWQPVGAAVCIGGPAAVVTGTAAPYTVTVACRGTDNALWYNTAPVPASGLPSFTTPWTSLGGVLSAGPAAAPVGAMMTFFVRGTNGAIYTRTATAGYAATTWACIGAPAAAQRAADRVTTFACQGTDRALWQATSDGSQWSPAESLGGVLIGGPGVAATTRETDLLAEGTDQEAWEQTAAGWSALGGVIVGGVGAAALN